MHTSLPVLFLEQEEQKLREEQKYVPSLCGLYLPYGVSKNIKFSAQTIWLKNITNLNGNLNKDSKSFWL